MRLALALALTLAADPAGATCRHFSRWYYPWPQPQHCGVAHIQRVAVRRAPPAPSEDEEREKAIEKLKLILGENQ